MRNLETKKYRKTMVSEYLKTPDVSVDAVTFNRIEGSGRDAGDPDQRAAQLYWISKQILKWLSSMLTPSFISRKNE
jgi:hypothetical protein